MNLKFTHRVISIAVVSILTACSVKRVDDTPTEPTSIVTAKFIVNGLYAPDYQGTQTVYARKNMRAIDQKIKFDSFFMKWANYDVTTIFKIYENLLWQIDHDKQSYRECPIAGCKDVFAELMAKTQSASDKENQYETYEEKSCDVTLDKNDFTVVATHKNRQIGGLPSQEYKVTWTTEFKDKNGNVDLNLLQFVFWTTAPTAQMKDAWKIHEKVTDNYLDKVGDKNGLVRLLGKDGFKAISAFSGDIERSDNNQFNNIAQKLETIKGYPLSIKMEWFQKSEACPVSKNKRSNETLDLSQGLGNTAVSFFGDIIKDKSDEIVEGVVAEWLKDARVRYIYEVTSVSEKHIKNSKFDMPYGYKIEDRQ